MVLRSIGGNNYEENRGVFGQKNRGVFGQVT